MNSVTSGMKQAAMAVSFLLMLAGAVIILIAMMSVGFGGTPDAMQYVNATAAAGVSCAAVGLISACRLAAK